MDKSELNALEANKRDRKIEITDIAVDKVPYIRYKEIPEEYYGIIQELAKAALLYARNNNDCNETAITYSMESPELYVDGEPYLAISYGDEHSVEPTSDTLSNHLIVSASGCVVIIVHNHPSLSKISLQDIVYLLRFASVKMIVAVTNLGGINYVVKSDKYNRVEALKLYAEAAELFMRAESLKSKQDATNYFLRNCSKVGIIFEE